MMARRNMHCEPDNDAFPNHAYRVRGYGGIAFYVHGWETQPDEDTEWSGYENRTGNVVVTMIGDDRRIIVEESDLTPLKRSDYCGECGQIGCAHDGLDRSEDSE